MCGRNIAKPSTGNLSSKLSLIFIAKKRHGDFLPLSQLCPTRAPRAAQSKVLCGPVEVVAAVKVSYILTTCLYFDS